MSKKKHQDISHITHLFIHALHLQMHAYDEVNYFMDYFTKLGSLHERQPIHMFTIHIHIYTHRRTYLDLNTHMHTYVQIFRYMQNYMIYNFYLMIQQLIKSIHTGCHIASSNYHMVWSLYCSLYDTICYIVWLGFYAIYTINSLHVSIQFAYLAFYVNAKCMLE